MGRWRQRINYKKLYTVLSYLGVFTFCTCCILICLTCFVASFKLCFCWLAVCIVAVVLCVCVCVCVCLCVILCVFVVLCVYCCFFALDAELLARSQYSEGPANGHLDTGFSWFPCA